MDSITIILQMSLNQLLGNTLVFFLFLSKQKETVWLSVVVAENQLSSSLREAHTFKGGTHFLSEEWSVYESKLKAFYHIAF